MSEEAASSNGKRTTVPCARMVRGSRAARSSKLAAGAVGIVFGDIGTSPLYAFRETFIGHHPLELDKIHVLGVVSLIFWSMTLGRLDPVCDHIDAC